MWVNFNKKAELINKTPLDFSLYMILFSYLPDFAHKKPAHF